jgi:hypothetical protein
VSFKQRIMGQGLFKDITMNFNTTLVGQFICAFAIILTLAGYYLGKRKTNTPKLTATIGFFSAFFPPFGVMFLIVLALKTDLPPEQ